MIPCRDAHAMFIRGGLSRYVSLLGIGLSFWVLMSIVINGDL